MGMSAMMHRVILFTTVLSGITLSGAPAQNDAASRAAFEVASIKPVAFPNESYFAGYAAGAGNCAFYKFEPTGNRFFQSSITLCMLIREAYDVTDLQIVGLPEWADQQKQSAWYQVEGRAAGNTPLTVEQTRPMLRALLADRFKLKIRRGTKSTPIYTLVVDKGGLKMKLSESVDAVGASGSKIDFGQIHESRKPIGLLVMYLTGRAAGRMIVDKTGFTGLYDIDLKWTPDLLANGVGLPPGAETDAPGPSLFTALQEQLGLRLVSETGQVDAFVVESVEKPTEN